MSEVVNALVAIAVIVFIVRWATSSSETPAERATAAALGFRPKKATDEMVDTVAAMFPDIPRDNIRFDLLRTGSVERTTNRILERGFLDAPPAAYHTVYPRTPHTAAANAPAPAPPPAAPKPKPPTLIERFQLAERVVPAASAPSPGPADTHAAEPETPEMAGGKATWEDTPAAREASLRERKARMILAARQRLLAQQQAAASASDSGAS